MRRAKAFTLLELLVVIMIIALVAAFLLPSLGTGSARTVESATRQFSAELQNARLIAIAQRARTRVLVAATNDANWGNNTSWRTYAVVKFDATASRWVLQGKINRMPDGVIFDPTVPAPTPSPSPGRSPPTYVLSTRKTSITAVAKSAAATNTNDFTGAYVEFRPTGGTSLDPTSGDELLFVQDGFVPNGGATPVAKNKNLKSQISLNPLTGSVLVQ